MNLFGASFVIFATRSFAALGAAAILTACAPDSGDQGSTSSAAGATNGVALTGAGATFPYPIYGKWFNDYAAKTGIKINYQSIGSGGGVRQIIEQTVDFGASDSPMSDEELGRAKGGRFSISRRCSALTSSPTTSQVLRRA